MTNGNFFSKTTTGVADGNSFSIDGSSSSTNAVEVHTFAVTAGCKVYKEIDTTTDGTYDASFLVESKDEQFHSQKNKIEVSVSKNMRLRFENTSGGPADYHVTGIEVSD